MLASHARHACCLQKPSSSALRTFICMRTLQTKVAQQHARGHGTRLYSLLLYFVGIAKLLSEYKCNQHPHTSWYTSVDTSRVLQDPFDLRLDWSHSVVGGSVAPVRQCRTRLAAAGFPGDARSGRHQVSLDRAVRPQRYRWQIFCARDKTPLCQCDVCVLCCRASKI
jgi:hypothetical protein